MQENPWHLRRLTFWRRRAYSDLELLFSLVRLTREASEVTESEPGLWQKNELDWGDLFPEEIARQERSRLLKTLERQVKVFTEGWEPAMKAGHLFSSTLLSPTSDPQKAVLSMLKTPVVRGFDWNAHQAAFTEEHRKTHLRWRWNRPPAPALRPFLLHWLDGYLSGLGHPSRSEAEEWKGRSIVHTRWILN